MSRHTPGPWIVDDRHVHCEKGFVNTDPRLMLEDDIVCEVNTDCRDGGLLTEVDKANLQLIAAAPTLLNAVYDLLAIVETEYEADPEREDLPSWKIVIDAANAALVKAQVES